MTVHVVIVTRYEAIVTVYSETVTTANFYKIQCRPDELFALLLKVFRVTTSVAGYMNILYEP